MKVIHKVVRGRMLGTTAACGRWVAGIDNAPVWRLVTCKECLKRRQTGKDGKG